MAKRSLQKEVELEGRLRRIEQLMLRGVTNQQELAAAFGVPQSRISTHMKEIRRRWREADEEATADERVLRQRQFENLLQMALNSFERSKKDAEEVVTHEEVCGACDGKKFTSEFGEKKECKNCEGRGKVLREVTRVKGQVGDVAFLKLAKELVAELARLKGIYPENASIRNLVAATRNVDGELQTQVQEMIIEGPVDTIIRAKAMLAELDHGMKNGSIQVLDVQPEVKEEEQDDED